MTNAHDGVVLFGTGSPVIVDVEESLHRLDVRLVAAVRNVPGRSFLLDSAAVIDVSEITAELLNLPFLVPLFRPAHREGAVAEARRLGFQHAATVIDPTAILPRSLECGNGLYVNAGCTIGAASHVGDFVFVNRGVALGHHAHLGDFVSIGPGVVVAGQVTIGPGTLIGAGAVVLPGVRIGANAVVGAGAVVTKDVADGCLVVGTPARFVRTTVAGN